MIVSGGHILAIDGINTGDSILGDGLRTPLEVNPDVIEYYSAGPGIELHPDGEGTTEIENTDHVFYEECFGSIDGTTMTVSAGHDKYCKFNVPDTITELNIITEDTDDPTTVSKAQFEFSLTSGTNLEDVYVLDVNEDECLMMAPMYWLGDVTYQGTVTNKIATIFGYKKSVNIIETSNGHTIVTSNGDSIEIGKN